MKNCFFVLLVFLFPQLLHAQAPPVAEWVVQTQGGNSYTKPQDIAIDQNGNLITVGVFSGATDFDPGSGVYSENSNGSTTAYIQKLSASGTFEWVVPILPITTATGKYTPKAVKTDAAGNVYMTGVSDGHLDYAAGSATQIVLGTYTNDDICVAKYDSAGNSLWAFRIGEWQHVESVNDIAIDASGNVYLTGTFDYIVDFNPDQNGTYVMTATGSTYDAFVCKYDTDGNFVWAKRIGGTEYASVNAMAFNTAGELILAGSFRSTCDFDPDSATVLNLTANGSYDIFISALDTAGNLLWNKRIGNATTESVNDMDIDTSGNIYIGGYMKGTTDFDPGAGVYNISTAFASVFQLFLVKLDSQGNFIWALNMGGDDDTYLESMACDEDGNVYCAGAFDGTIDFNPSAAIYNLISTTSSKTDGFVTKFTAAGNFNWGKSFGDDESERVYAIELFNYKPYIAGSFSSLQMNIDGTVVSTNSTFNLKTFQAKLGIVPSGINDTEKQLLITYPNPTTGTLYFNLEENYTRGTIYIYDLQGRILWNEAVNNSNETAIHFNGVPGEYLIKFIADDRVIVTRFVLE